MTKDPRGTGGDDEWLQENVRAFAGRPLPEPGAPAGYAALIQHYDLKTPLPLLLTALAARRNPSSTPEWRMLAPGRSPTPDLAGPLAFAFK